jgi:hypothetical protein
MSTLTVTRKTLDGLGISAADLQDATFDRACEAQPRGHAGLPGFDMTRDIAVVVLPSGGVVLPQ